MNKEAEKRKRQYLRDLAAIRKESGNVISFYLNTPCCIRVVKVICSLGREWLPGQPRPNRQSVILTGVAVGLLDIYPKGRKYHILTTNERGILPANAKMFFIDTLKPFYDDNKNDIPQCR